jgi:hypothetical protein
MLDSKENISHLPVAVDAQFPSFLILIEFPVRAHPFQSDWGQVRQ